MELQMKLAVGKMAKSNSVEAILTRVLGKVGGGVVISLL
jgi:hypothetical protein